MNRKVAYLLLVLMGVCLFYGCKNDTANKFTENIKESYANSDGNLPEGEIIGKITEISGTNITISLLERETYGDKKPMAMNEQIKPDAYEENGDKPVESPSESTEADKPKETEDTKLPEAPEGSESPLQGKEKYREEGKSDFMFYEVGTTLEITIAEDTKIIKNEEDITLDTLHEGNIIFIESDGEAITQIRVDYIARGGKTAPQPSGDTSTSEPE